MKHLIFKFIVFCWNILPKKGLTRFIKKRPDMMRKLYQDLRFKGVMEVPIDGKKFNLYNPGITTLENEIYWKGIEGGWEKISIAIWVELSRNANTILDIGANTGIFSLVAATVNPEADVIAFEPVKRTADIARQNLAKNSGLNIQLIQKAVSDQNGTATFYDVDADSQYSASLNKEMLKDADGQIEYTVDVVRGDDYPFNENARIDLIKLDVEMHEPEAIEGMLELLKRDKPSMLVEVLTDEIAARVESFVKDLGYIYFTIDEENPPRKVTAMEKSGSRNLLLIQADKISLLPSF